MHICGLTVILLAIAKCAGNMTAVAYVVDTARVSFTYYSIHIACVTSFRIA